MNESPPDPITDTFNPTAWAEPIGILSKLRILFHSYVTYPIAQNYPIIFTNLVFVTDATLTKMANTSYVIANLVPYLASLPPLITSTTWSAIQNFTGIETNTINPIGGTLIIGSGADNDIRIASQNSRSVVLHLGDGNSATSGAGIHIGNGVNCLGNVEILHGTGSTGTITLGSSTSTTSLGCPLTPDYNYSPMPFAQGANTSVTYGTVGRIGTTILARGGNFYVPDGRITNANWYIMFGLVSITLPVGVWFLNGEVTNTGGTNTTALGIAFNDTNRDSPNVAPASFTNVGAFAKKYFFLAPSSSYNTTVSATYTVTTGTKTIWLQVGSIGYGFFNGPCYFTATRIA